MKDNVVSVSRLKAVAKMRVWYMEHSFHRQLRTHVDLFRRELDIMREVLGHFGAFTIERETGGPTLHIMQELSSSGSASTSAPAASASGVHAPDAGKADGASSSSSGESKDSLTSSATVLQEPGPSTQEAVVVDTLLASLQELEASAASDAMSMLQWTFTKMSNLVSRHIAVADSILRQDQQRSLVVLGDDGEVEEQEESPPTPQRQLVLDLELMHKRIHKTKEGLSWNVARLHHVLGELPPIPSAVRLPPTPPSADAGGHLARFSLIFKKPFSRSK